MKGAEQGKNVWWVANVFLLFCLNATGAGNIDEISEV